MDICKVLVWMMVMIFVIFGILYQLRGLEIAHSGPITAGGLSITIHEPATRSLKEMAETVTMLLLWITIACVAAMRLLCSSLKGENRLHPMQHTTVNDAAARLQQQDHGL